MRAMLVHIICDVMEIVIGQFVQKALLNNSPYLVMIDIKR